MHDTNHKFDSLLGLFFLISDGKLEERGGVAHGNETKLVMVPVNNFAAANVISFSLSGYIRACTWQGLKLQYEL